MAHQWFSPSTPVSSKNKTDRHKITNILLKGVLNTINLKPFNGKNVMEQRLHNLNFISIDTSMYENNTE